MCMWFACIFMLWISTVAVSVMCMFAVIIIHVHCVCMCGIDVHYC